MKTYLIILLKKYLIGTEKKTMLYFGLSGAQSV